MVNVVNPSTQETKAGICGQFSLQSEFLRQPGSGSGLHTETFSQKINRQTNKQINSKKKKNVVKQLYLKSCIYHSTIECNFISHKIEAKGTVSQLEE